MLAAKSAVFVLRNVCIKDVMYDCEVSKKLQAILKNHPHLDALSAHIDLSSPETSLLASGMMGPDGSYTASPLVPNLNSSSAKGKVSAKPIDIGFDLPYVPLYWFEHMLQYSLDEHLTPQQQAQLSAQVQQQIGGVPGGYRSQPPLPPLYNGAPGQGRMGGGPLSPRMQQQQQAQYYRGGGRQPYPAVYGGGYYPYDPAAAAYGHTGVPPQQLPMQSGQPHLIPTFYDPISGNYYVQSAPGAPLMPQQHQQALHSQEMYYYGDTGMVDSLVGPEDPLTYYDDYAIQPPPLQQQQQQRGVVYGMQQQQYPLVPPLAASPAPTMNGTQLSSLDLNRSASVGSATGTETNSVVETVPPAPLPSASINVSLQDTNLLSEEQLSATGLTANAPVFKMKTPFPLPAPTAASVTSVPPVNGSSSSAAPTAASSTSTSPVPSLPGPGGVTPPSVMYGSDFSFSANGAVGTVTAANLNSVSASAMLLFGGGGAPGSAVVGNRNRTISTSSNTSVASSITTTSISNPVVVPPPLSSVSAATAPIPPLLCRSVSDTNYTRLLHANNAAVAPGSMVGAAPVVAGAATDIDLLMNKSYFSSSSLMSLDSSSTAANGAGGGSLLFSGGSAGLGSWNGGAAPTSSRILSLNASNSSVNTAAGSVGLGVNTSTNNADLLPEFDLALDFNSSPRAGGGGSSTANKSPTNGGDRSPFSLAVGSGTNLEGPKLRTSSDFTDRSRLNSNNSVEVAELLAGTPNAKQQLVEGCEQ